jgi:hypothetical protein
MQMIDATADSHRHIRHGLRLRDGWSADKKSSGDEKGLHEKPSE